MISRGLFENFCSDRNLKEGTKKGYYVALEMYEYFNGMSLELLFEEAKAEETERIPHNDRKIKKRLIDFRTFLVTGNLSPSSSKTYFSKIKSFYSHFGFEIPQLPQIKFGKDYETNYNDLPTRKHIKQALNSATIDLKAVILFMSSSGTAKAETLSLTVGDFLNACEEYHQGGSIKEILNTLRNRDDIVPTFYIRRIKTNKYYYTFCSPEASSQIVDYLKSRKNLKYSDKLFDFSPSSLLNNFQHINDKNGWGYKGSYRFFRSHTLRKFHASNIGLHAEYVDSLQGRGKGEIHETYIKTNPKKLKEIYKSAMKNVMIYEWDRPVKEEFNIVINVFLFDKDYQILP